MLCLDGANRFDPLLIARLARQRGIAAAEFNRRIRVARAFTCFQLTELLVRVPRFARKICRRRADCDGAAGPVLRRGRARARRRCGVPPRAGRAAGAALRCRWASRCFPTRRRLSHGGPRRAMFTQLTAQATELWRFALDGEDGKLRLIGEKGAGPQVAGRQVCRLTVACLSVFGFLCVLCALCGERFFSLRRRKSI